ncbi:unnamed protein product [Haemonchus placei]|uniref:Reverse transcriptase domain-containing protein n=1 Tax=Haemonchus placei TaxID=6290 RepID=A0A0N4X9V3_HAEPC|nr:unnamed protein product [Haemonchus placei]
MDLDKYTERIPGPNTKVRDASGNIMEFLDTIRIAITLEGQEKLVSAFVGRSPDEVVFLGTNALELFNLRLLKNPEVAREQMATKKTTRVAAEVKNRTYISARAVRTLTLTCTRKGEEIGEWEDSAWVKPRYIEPDRNMLDLDRSEICRPKESRNDRITCQQNQLPSEAAIMLKEFNDVFALSDAELTQTDLVVHKIDTGDHKPIRQKTRPVPIAARKEFRETIKDLLARGIVERSSSEWASPVVLVRKKDGTLRVCIDYRELNKVVRQDSYPLPKIDNVLQCLAGKKFSSTMDLASGYWQIRLSDDAKRKSAFTTSEGLFQFTVLPFGLSTSPAVFQRMMDMVLRGLGLEDEVFVYIDDILVATESMERHYIELRRVLEALRKANLRLKPQKCTFFRENVSSRALHRRRRSEDGPC